MPTEYRKITAADQDRVLRAAVKRAQKYLRITPGQRRHVVNVTVTEPKSDHWHCPVCIKPWSNSIRASLCCMGARIDGEA